MVITSFHQFLGLIFLGGWFFYIVLVLFGGFFKMFDYMIREKNG